MDATHARGTEGWVSFFADSGAQLPDRGPALVGHAAIRAHMRAAFSDPAVQLRWAPTRGDVAASGDLGYTYGSWRLVARDSAGAERVAGRGKYITVWQRDAAGRWKVAVDGGNQEPPPRP
jgi:ketosteroid isomerase-like protein